MNKTDKIALISLYTFVFVIFIIPVLTHPEPLGTTDVPKHIHYTTVLSESTSYEEFSSEVSQYREVNSLIYPQGLRILGATFIKETNLDTLVAIKSLSIIFMLTLVHLLFFAARAFSENIAFSALVTFLVISIPFNVILFPQYRTSNLGLILGLLLFLIYFRRQFQDASYLILALAFPTLLITHTSSSLEFIFFAPFLVGLVPRTIISFRKKSAFLAIQYLFLPVMFFLDPTNLNNIPVKLSQFFRSTPFDLFTPYFETMFSFSLTSFITYLILIIFILLSTYILDSLAHNKFYKTRLGSKKHYFALLPILPLHLGRDALDLFLLSGPLHIFLLLFSFSICYKYSRFLCLALFSTFYIFLIVSSGTELDSKVRTYMYLLLPASILSASGFFYITRHLKTELKIPFTFMIILVLLATSFLGTYFYLPNITTNSEERMYFSWTNANLDEDDFVLIPFTGYHMEYYAGVKGENSLPASFSTKTAYYTFKDIMLGDQDSLNHYRGILGSFYVGESIRYTHTPEGETSNLEALDLYSVYSTSETSIFLA